MKLSDMIFSDGKIVSYKTINQGLNLIFKDNGEKDFEIRFSQVTTLKDFDSIGFSICRSNLKKLGDKQSL
jgi:hypothetical protein